jgi:6-pyruvoyltetrahydropterin/6-carboxytetrahydropterin synthase
MGKYQSTKVFDGYSVALRQHKAQHSHCCLLHGYGIYFHITFESINGTLDEMNWIQDYGSFKRNGLKDWLAEMFDHTVLIEKDDPMRPLFEEFGQYKIGKVHFLDKMGMESIAKMVFDKFNDTLSKQEGGRVKVVRVEAFEHEKNSAIYSSMGEETK